ncbi:MAG: tRNA (adenine-N1)-methyltransferase [Promethearchaeota archaeon]
MPIKNRDLVYIIFDKRRKFLRTVVEGEQFHCDRGYIDYSEIIGKEYGIIIESKPYKNKAYILKPLPSDIILKMGRASQIIYPEDMGLILMYTGIQPGYRILEAGCGSGALTSIMALHVKPNGHIYSFDIRSNAIKQTKKNLRKLGLEQFVTLTLRDIVAEDFSDIIEKQCDVVMLDMATPWLAIHKILPYLKKSGVCCCFSPVIEQVKKNHKALKENGFMAILAT